MNRFARDLFDLGEALSRALMVSQQYIPDRPLHPDDMPPKGGSLPASLRDDEDETNADIFDDSEEE